jgi:hypothetical protein
VQTQLDLSARSIPIICDSATSSATLGGAFHVVAGRLRSGPASRYCLSATTFLHWAFVMLEGPALGLMSFEASVQF